MRPGGRARSGWPRTARPTAAVRGGVLRVRRAARGEGADRPKARKQGPAGLRRCAHLLRTRQQTPRAAAPQESWPPCSTARPAAGAALTPAPRSRRTRCRVRRRPAGRIAPPRQRGR
eukprot:7387024-Prymnesium_polylepis.2